MLAYIAILFRPIAVKIRNGVSLLFRMVSAYSTVWCDPMVSAYSAVLCPPVVLYCVVPSFRTVSAYNSVWGRPIAPYCDVL